MSISKRGKISEEGAKKIEIIAIIALIVFALLSYAISNLIFKKDKRNIAIYKDGIKIVQVDGRRIDINIDGTYTIGDRNGEYNIIEIKDKKIKCIEANCPDSICVKHGVLNDLVDNDMIICAPHGMAIVYE